MPKKGAWAICRFEGGGLARKRGGGVFEEGVDTLMHIMPTQWSSHLTSLNTVSNLWNSSLYFKVKQILSVFSAALWLWLPICSWPASV